jgi:hypothetical protein
MRGVTSRAFPWTRLLAVARAAVATKGHWDKLAPAERRLLIRLVRKSKGKASNLTLRERQQLRRLVAKLELRRLGRDLAVLASPLSRPRRRS